MGMARNQASHLFRRVHGSRRRNSRSKNIRRTDTRRHIGNPILPGIRIIWLILEYFRRNDFLI